MTQAPIRLCFVCLGNICRSPTAEGVMKKLVADAGLAQRIAIDSAGTGDYHVGEPADSRSRGEASRRGIELTGVARQFVAYDFDAFDYVLAMDRRNLRDLRELASSPAQRAKLHLLRSFEPGASGDLDVPDPYAGDGDGFVRVFDICLAACAGLLAHLRHTQFK
jgi:protein-tyrosine phosphatase